MATKKVTIRDIAQRSGVSVTTVSRALNDQADISDQTRKRVLEAARALDYSPNIYAKSLRATTSKVIAVVQKGPLNPFFLEVLDSLEAEIRAIGYTMTLVRVQHGKDEVALALETLATTPVSGLVFLGGWFYDVERLAQIDVPFVHCTVPMQQESEQPNLPLQDLYSTVAVDEEIGMSLIVDHLYDLGHERIAFLGSDEDDCSVGMLRETAFRKALRARNLPVDERLIVHGTANSMPYSYDYGAQLMARLLDSSVEFSAVAALTDVMAIGAIRTASDAHLRVPHDVAIVGFDGIEQGGYTCPRLTTVLQPVAEIASNTVLALQDLMEGQESKQLLLPPTLLIRESSSTVSADE